MNNAVFINARALTPYAYKELPGGKSAFDHVIDTAVSLPDTGKIYVLAGDSFNKEGPFDIVREPVNSMEDLFAVMIRYAGKSDTLYYLYGDTPLIDPAIVQRMYKNHKNYFASYTFADGYPYGLALEILQGGILSRLAALAGKYHFPVTRGGIFEVIQKDINSFDIETEISEKDQRMLRVSLAADTKRNFNQLKRIMEGGGVDEQSVVNLLETRQDLLRTEPAYVTVQIASGCPQACTYCPYPAVYQDILKNKEVMPLDNWKVILDRVKQFSDDAVFSVSLWGEPSFHPDIIDLVKETLAYPSFSLVIETSGLGWSNETIDAIKEVSDGRVTWILSLDGENETIYRQLRGEGWSEARAAAEYLFKKFKDHFYLQSVRMKANEEYLEKFYREWKAKGVQTIIQKYDYFCGMLPDEKVTDISPVRRFPCWHLKRDLTVLIDGTVQLCREDINNEHPLGNIFSEDLSVIWERGMPLYLNHIHGEYPELCRKCDEYYTYNF